MRINVYAEELTSETELITKQVIPNAQTEPVTFYGIRFYLKSPAALHHSETDDDRSAITLWAPWTKAKGNDFVILLNLLFKLRVDLDAAIDSDAISRAQ